MAVWPIGILPAGGNVSTRRDTGCPTGKMPVLRSALTRRLGKRPAFHLESHQLAHVFHRWAPVGNHLVVVFLEVKIVAKLLLLGSA